MYELGENFKFDMSKAVANPECIFKGTKYRITVLTERLVRLEYSNNGVFIDNPTELVWYRNLDKPEFKVEENNTNLKISTKYFELNYIKESSFYGGKIKPTKNLNISLLGTDKVWYYGHPEIRNYGYYAYNDKGNIVDKKALYSQDGFVSIDDSNNLIAYENGSFKKKENESLDIYVFLYNKDFYYCLNDYFKITGFPPLIPKYALGVSLSKNTKYTQYDIPSVIKNYEEHNIPISLFLLKNWEGNNLYQFSNDYNEITNLIKFLNTKNIRIGLDLKYTSLFPTTINNYDVFRQYLACDAKGCIPFNVLDERSIDAYLKIIIHPLNNIGVNYYSISSFSINEIDKLSIFKHYLYKDKNIGDNTERPFIISNNYMKASHRYSVIHAGDSNVSWNSLKDALKYNLSATNMGLSYLSHDFGGTKDGVEDSELFTRFIQLGTFSPILNLSSNESKYYKREPWRWNYSTSQITTYFMNLRYKLIPYIYTEAYKYHKFGKPLIEPIYYRYPLLYDDYVNNKNFFFGSTFYISPIIDKKDSTMDRVIHKLYIPDGVWYDYFTGKKYIGNRKYVSFYKDSDYPVFVKSGAIIPKTKNNNYMSLNDLEIEVFPGDNNTYSIYEDDGITNNYLSGNFAITNIEFTYKKDSYVLTVLPTQGKLSVLPEKRNFYFKFKNTKLTAIAKTYVNGNEVPNNKIRKSTDLIIELKDIPTSAQITVVVSGTDIEIESKQIINDDMVSIISDLPIKTILKDKIDSILFDDNLPLKKKRILIKKMASGKDHLEGKYIELFLKLLEYISEV